MTKVVSPSEPITDGQIGKTNELLSAVIRKNSKELPSDAVQEVLSSRQGGQMAKEMFAILRKYVDAVSDLITRIVTVDRNRSPQEALKATGRNQYVADSVAAEMPKGEGEETEVIFFKVGRTISDNDLEKEYELRGLIPADPYSLAAVNEADPAFGDEHPNGTHWKDKDGKWCFAAFDRWRVVERLVVVNRCDDDWFASWWFAGVRKSTSSSDVSTS